jgi:hypothetical protein
MSTNPPSLPHQQPASADSDQLIEPLKTAKPCGGGLAANVGQTLRRRAAYIAVFLYWSARHLSFSRGRWVAAFEGYQW